MHELSQKLNEVTVMGERGPYFLDYIPVAPLPKPLYSFGSFLSEGKIYVIAGDETRVKSASAVMKGTKAGVEAWEYHSSNMYVYDIAHDSWTMGERKFAPRAYHMTHLYQDKIFVIGGKGILLTVNLNIRMLLWRFMIWLKIPYILTRLILIRQ